MKKIFLTTSLAAIGLAFTAFIAPKTSVDNNFEGVITFSLSVDNPQAQSMMASSSLKIYLKGHKAKSITDMGMMKITSYADHSTTDKPIVIEEMGGNKYQVKNDDSKKDDKTPDIKYVDGTKVIAGYTCKKAQVTTTNPANGQSNTLDIYYTDELPVYEGSKGEFKGLKGFPLEFASSQRGMIFSFAATEVKKQSLSDDIFVAPTGCKLMTQQEIMQEMQKNMSGGGGN
jgi:GLPGLI family protein